MQFDLFSMLADNSEECDKLPERMTLITSIKSHLSQLLNSRQGTLFHLPDYGLPDVQSLFIDLPDSLQNLIGSVQKVIERYEPRLKNIRVISTCAASHDNPIHLQILAQLLTGDDAQFDTQFSACGLARVT